MDKCQNELIKCIQDNDLEGAKLCLKEKKTRIDCVDENGMTAISHAAYKGNIELCKILLDRGANVNSSEHEHGYTPLMFAGIGGHLKVVSLLLEHGASTTAVNKVNRTAAQMSGKLSVVINTTI